MVIESEQGDTEVVHEVAQLERASLQPETLGLMLTEAKSLLQGVQQTMVKHQVSEYLQQQLLCPGCGQKRLRKGVRSMMYRTVANRQVLLGQPSSALMSRFITWGLNKCCPSFTRFSPALFGKLPLRSFRLFHCECQPHATRTFNPLGDLLAGRTAPERLYLESKFAALMSYGLTVKLLADVLPMESELNAVTVRNHVHQVAQRLESELGEEQFIFIDGCEGDWEALPRPDLPLTVGLDGGYVHSCEQKSRKESWFEIITGKSVTADGVAKRFGFVNGYDEKPKRRLFELLKSQGMQMNQQVTFLSDGGDTVRELQLYLNPQAEHLLDWFHVTMRITVMNQMAKGLSDKATELRSDVLKELERIKWFLWHGNVFKALQSIGDIDLDLDDGSLDEKQTKLLKALREFQTYIENNASFIPNYGERWRYGETISTAFVESTVNQVISKRMVKKQQMRWSRQGAHLLLQIRTKVLDEELRNTFQRWYSGFELSNENLKQAA